jgi:rhamnulokinase
VLRLWSEIQNGLALGAKRFGQAVRALGVDTWGVDYVLLSRSDELLGQPFHYRDARTRGVMAQALGCVPREEIFAQTGVQFMEINTLYQLLAQQRQSPELFGAAACFLTIPDFLNWCLAGTHVCEFSNATTTQCFNPRTGTWAGALLDKLGLPTRIFPEIVPPGRAPGFAPHVPGPAHRARSGGR